MAFRNPAIAGTYLVRSAIQSPNYVAGTNGWTINRDGTAELNTGTYRGNIEVGPTTGQHFVINDPATGDIWDAYDSNNDLVSFANGGGDIGSLLWNLGEQQRVSLGGGELFFENINASSVSQEKAEATLIGEGAFQGRSLNIVVTPLTPTGLTPGQLQICAQGSPTGSNAGATILANERGTFGSVAVTDRQSQNNRFHAASYSGTTNASGSLTLPHNALFTPADAVITGTAHGSSFANLTWGYDGADATNFTTNWTIANSGAPWATRFVTFSALFWG